VSDSEVPPGEVFLKLASGWQDSPFDEIVEWRDQPIPHVIQREREREREREQRATHQTSKSKQRFGKQLAEIATDAYRAR
jgi:hypothetical protein